MIQPRWVVILLAALAASCGGSDGPPDDDRDGVANADDCAPNDAASWQNRSFLSRDADADGFAANATGQLCAGGNLPAGYFATAAINADCDDADISRWAQRTHASRDGDGDSYRVNDAGSMCVGASLPASYFADAVPTGDVDCDDADQARWANRAFTGLDQDGDTRYVVQAGAMCVGPALPAPYVAVPITVALTDCDDTDAARWKFATVYRDQDGDGVGAGPFLIPCIGDAPAAGYAFKGFDPNDDPAVPGAALEFDFDLPPTLLLPPEEADDEDLFP